MDRTIERWMINISLRSDEKKDLIETYEKEGFSIAARVLKLIRQDVKQLKWNETRSWK